MRTFKCLGVIRELFSQKIFSIYLNVLFMSSIEYKNLIKRCCILLNIKEEADQETARQAYLELAKKYHPDSGCSEADAEKFKEIDEAFRTLTKKYAQDRWDVEEKQRIHEFNIEEHTAPQHRQYLNFEGVGSGTPAQREKQWIKSRASRAAQNVMEHRVAKSAATEHALMDKNSSKRVKHQIKTKYGIDRLVEDLIQESMSKGEFDNLKGSGKPLPLHQNTNPYVDFVTHKMNQVLIDNGFTPEWISLQKEIYQNTHTLRANLLSDRGRIGPLPLTDKDADLWSSCIEKNSQFVKQINSKINHYNLVVPILQKQMFLISLQNEAQNALLRGKNKLQLPIMKEMVKKDVQHQDLLTMIISLFK